MYFLVTNKTCRMNSSRNANQQLDFFFHMWCFTTVLWIGKMPTWALEIFKLRNVLMLASIYKTRTGITDQHKKENEIQIIIVWRHISQS